MVIPERILKALRKNKKRRINSRDFPKTKKGHCKWCEEPLTGRQTAWCKGGECSDNAMRLIFYLRELILEIDKDKCRLCKAHVNPNKLNIKPWWSIHNANNGDDKELKKLLKKYPHWFKESTYYKCGWEPHRHLFEVDHIKPLVEGGWTSPDNLRVLCIPCHKKVTAELRGRLKKK